MTLLPPLDGPLARATMPNSRGAQSHPALHAKCQLYLAGLASWTGSAPAENALASLFRVIVCVCGFQGDLESIFGGNALLVRVGVRRFFGSLVTSFCWFSAFVFSPWLEGSLGVCGLAGSGRLHSEPPSLLLRLTCTASIPLNHLVRPPLCQCPPDLKNPL